MPNMETPPSRGPAPRRSAGRRAVLLGLLLWTTATAAAQIRVAVVAPLTGPVPEVGRLMVRAAEISAERLRTGEWGARFDVRLSIHDDGCDAPRARALAARLAAQRFAAVIGHCPFLGDAVAPVYDRYRTLFIATPTWDSDAQPWRFYNGVVFRLGAGELERDAHADRGERWKRRSRDAVQAAFDLLFGAIRMTGTTETQTLADVLRAREHNTALGLLRSGESGRIRGRPRGFDREATTASRPPRPTAAPAPSGPASAPVIAAPRPVPRPDENGAAAAPPPDPGSRPVIAHRPRPRPSAPDTVGTANRIERPSVESVPQTDRRPDNPDNPDVAAAAPEMPVEVPAGAAPGGPAAAPAPLPRPAEPQWNSWTVGPGSKDAAVLDVDPDLTYEFVLDLSPFDYRRLRIASVAPAGVGPVLNDKIKTLRERDIDELRLKIRPLVLGTELEIIDPQPSGYELKLDLTKLTPTSQAQRSAAALRDRVLGGAATLDDFAHFVQAGEIRFQVAANRPGCANIALSVWDRRGLVPYDHLVRTVPVRARGGPTPVCGDRALRGGFKTLLGTALTHAQDNPPPADVALHIFEFAHRGRIRSVAVLADRADLEASGAGSRGVYAWEMKTALTDYVLVPAQLQSLLKAARDRAVGGRPYPYAALAAELAQKIFPADAEHAQLALATLKRRVAASDRRLNLLARIVSAEQQPIYLPLGLLAAQAPAPVLAKRVTVIQPLPRERYATRTQCIEPWTFTIPKQLQGVAIDLAALERPQSRWSRWLDTLSSLRDYLTGAAPAAVAARGEGLLLLAHHDGGVLWFDKPQERAIIEDFRRTFTPGSAAILAACSATGVKPENRLITRELNRRGIDAFIVSPFQIRADYGAQFAVEFAAAVQEVRDERREATLVELFDIAARETAKVFRDQDKNLDEMALEFMVLGDPNLRLCAAQP